MQSYYCVLCVLHRAQEGCVCKVLEELVQRQAVSQEVELLLYTVYTGIYRCPSLLYVCLLYVCPHATIYVPSYYYVRVSSYYHMCVLILLYVCAHTHMCVRLVYVCPPTS